MRDKNQERQELARWLYLKREARKAEKYRLAAPVSIEDFKFLLSQGGQLTQEDAPYIDNCYLSRLEVKVEKDRKIYRFKTLTEKKENFTFLSEK